MKARWVQHNPFDNHDNPGIVGQAVVASYWPGRYYLVSTIELDSGSPLSRLTKSIETGVHLGDVIPGPNTFLTGIYRCDKFGFTRSYEPLFANEWAERSDAKAGHDLIVSLFANGKLKTWTNRIVNSV